MDDYRSKMIAWLSSVRDQGAPRSFTEMFATIGANIRRQSERRVVITQLNELDEDGFARGLDLLSIWVTYKGKRGVFVPGGHERLLRKLKLVPQGKTAAEVREELRQRSSRRLAA